MHDEHTVGDALAPPCLFGHGGGVKGDESVDVKNYTVETKKGQDALVSNAASQTEYRGKHLPAGTTQNVVIDLRGQNVSREAPQQLLGDIVSKSNGRIRKDNITFIAD